MKTQMILTACVAAAIMLSALSTSAQTTRKQSVEQELVRTETGFFEARKLKDLAYFRSHIPENGVFWGENGTFSRGQQLQEQADSAKACTIEGYSLSDFGMLP